MKYFFSFFSPYEPDDGYHYQDRAILNGFLFQQQRPQNEFNCETMNTFLTFQYECRQLSLHLKFSRQTTTSILFGQARSNFTVGKHFLYNRDLSNDRKPKPNPTQGKFPEGNHLIQAGVATTIGIILTFWRSDKLITIIRLKRL